MKPYSRGAQIEPGSTDLTSLIISGLTTNFASSKRGRMFASQDAICQRRTALTQHADKPGTVTASSSMYMGIGDAIHNLVCTSLSNNGVLLFKEFSIEPPKTVGISGRIDAIIALDDEPHIIEIKSCGNLPAEPSFDHATQAQVYSLLTGIEKAHILYVSRNVGMPTPQMADLVVDTSESTLTDVATRIAEGAIAAKYALLPDIPSHMTKSKCGYCPFSHYCWNGAPISVKLEQFDTSLYEIEIEEIVDELVGLRATRRRGILKHISGHAKEPDAKKKAYDMYRKEVSMLPPLP